MEAGQQRRKSRNGRKAVDGTTKPSEKKIRGKETRPARANTIRKQGGKRLRTSEHPQLICQQGGRVEKSSKGRSAERFLPEGKNPKERGRGEKTPNSLCPALIPGGRHKKSFKKQFH